MHAVVLLQMGGRGVVHAVLVVGGRAVELGADQRDAGGDAIAAFNLAALASVVTLLPRALRQVDLRTSGMMIVIALPMVALGIRVLRVTDVTLLRWAVVACAKGSSL